MSPLRTRRFPLGTDRFGYTCLPTSGAAMDLAPNQTLGQYRIVQKIGEGGMGAVYKADQPSVRRTVVIKVLSASFAEYADAGQRFQRELKMITRLEHPHILPVYDYGEVDGRPYIVMRHMTGGSLQDRLQDGKPSRSDLLRVLDQVALALDFAHDQGIIHRDLKPGNILLDESGNAYLADFGLAKTVGGTHDLTADGSVLGSPAYMSPEQARGARLDRRSDVYAYAILIYRVLCGHLPFESDTAWGYITKHITEEPPSIRNFAPDLPQGLDPVLRSGMAKDPASRPERATELMAAVRAALSGAAEAPTKARPSAAAAAPDAAGISQTMVAAGAPASVGAVARPARRSGFPLPVLLGVGGLGLLVAGAVVAGILYLAGRGLSAPDEISYPVGRQPRAVLFDGQALWVANYFDNSVTQLTAFGCAASPGTCGQTLGTYPVSGLPSALAFDGRRLWVASAQTRTLSALDPVSGTVEANVDLNHIPTSLLWADSNLWIASDFGNTVTKLSADGTVLADLDVGLGPVGLAFDGSSLWVVLQGDQALIRIDPGGPSVADRTPLDGEPTAIAFDGVSIWVAIRDPGQVIRVNPANPAETQRLGLGATPVALAYDGASLWVAAPEAEKVFRVDPVALRVTSTVSAPGFPVALTSAACGEGCLDIWTADQSSGTVTRISAR